MKKLWSIVVLTIPGREMLLARLMARLNAQLNIHIEIKIYPDSCASIGAKRQLALDECNSTYISFIDDDDLVPAYYVARIMDELKYQPYGVGFRGIITSDNEKPIEFIHRSGNKYIDKIIRSSDCHIYHRPLNHLNPVMSDIAKEIGFSNINFGEDRDYSIRLAESGLIKDDCFIDEFMYFYQYRKKRVRV